MEIVGGFFVFILLMAALKEIIPLIARILDSILLALFRVPIRILMALVKAPFRIVAHRIRSRSQLTPYALGLRRATEGMFLFAACISAASWFPVFLGGQSVFDLIAAFARAPADYPGVAVFLAVAALGLIWLIAGMRKAKGDRDPMSAWWSAVIAGGCLAALWWHLFPEPAFASSQTAALKTLYIATAAACLARLWLTMPMPNPSLAAVNRILRQRNAPMVGAQPRRRFFSR